MIGSAYTLQCKGHIRTDSLYGGWSPRTQGIVDVVCYIVMFMPFAAIFLWSGWGYFAKAFMTGERFVSSPWMPITWPFKAAMPLIKAAFPITTFKPQNTAAWDVAYARFTKLLK